MSQFIHPYYFIPVSPGGRIDDCPLSEVGRGAFSHVTHDRYVTSRPLKAEDGTDQTEPVYSGRIVCVLTTESPTLVGGHQERKSQRDFAIVEQARLPGRVDPAWLFRWKSVNPKLEAEAREQWQKSRPAIPGTSLRGVLSSLVEAASRSALRILDRTHVNEERDDPGDEPPLDYYALFDRVDPASTPLRRSGRRRSRELLTLAEAMWGVVEQSDGEQRESPDTAPLFALASRIVVSNALLDSQAQPKWLPGEVALRVLATPKPPYPSFYFAQTLQGNFGAIEKKLFGDGRQRMPSGRKAYVHQSRAGEPWRMHPDNVKDDSEKSLKKMASKAQVLDAGNRFAFHVDFTNLSMHELGALCYALRPTPAFRHKIGMGKPIGLGTVRVDPKLVLLTDRVQRYTSLRSPRYSRVWADPSAADDPPLKDHYASDLAAISGLLSDEGIAPDALADEFHDRQLGRADSGRVLDALEAIGDPRSIQAADGRPLPVHYPQVEGVTGAAMEREHFKWFMSNEQQRADAQQFLGLPNLGPQPDHEPSPAVPPLRRLPPPRNEDDRGSRGGRGGRRR